MTPEPEQAAVPEPAALSEMSRLSGVFFEPGKTFADIAERPCWFLPMLLVVLATMGFYVCYGQHIGWQQYAQDQMDNPRLQAQMQNLSAEQRANALAMQQKLAPVIFYFFVPVVAIPVMYLISSAVLLGIASGLMSAGIKFKQIFAIQCYAGLVTIVKWALAVVVMFLKAPDQFNLTNPLAFNPAAFMDPKATSKFIYTLGTGLDLFVIVSIVLMVIGLKAAGGKKLSTAGAAIAVVTPYALLLLLGATMAGMFS